MKGRNYFDKKCISALIFYRKQPKNRLRVNGFTIYAKEGSYMDKIGTYSAYQKSYAESVKSWKSEDIKKTEGMDKIKETEKVSEKEKVSLSDRAKELLKELQKKYGNMDFIIADYETDEEASALLARGTKEYSVLIEPEVLEQMAADEEVKSKYMGLIEESTSQLTNMREKLEEAGEEVTHLGVSIAEDGTTKFFAKLEQMSEKQKERIQNAKEARKKERAEAKEEAAEALENKRTEDAIESKEKLWSGPDKSKKLFIQADTIEELFEKIKAVDWSKVQEKAVESAGTKIDFTV